MIIDRVAAIIQAESDADKLQAESDSLRWQAAELIAAELADGKTFRALAAEISKSVGHVQRMAFCGRIPRDTGVPFKVAYQAAKVRKSVKAGAPKSKPQESGTPRVGDAVDMFAALSRCTERKLMGAMVTAYGADRDALRTLIRAAQDAADRIGA